jgi:hypothetical protein
MEKERELIPDLDDEEEIDKVAMAKAYITVMVFWIIVFLLLMINEAVTKIRARGIIIE